MGSGVWYATVRALSWIARGFAALVLTVLVLPYVFVPVYAPHAATPFRGTAVYNPYAQLTPHWQRANFHAHSRAWNGLTSGRQSPDSLYAAYAARHYDVRGISNYHLITRTSNDSTFLPIYEHGISIKKTHQLIIGARQVRALDFPLWQTTNAKQYFLDRLRDSAALTVIVHPYMREGYGKTELASLSGYDLLEVRSHWNTAAAWWDTVLTAGNPVWGIGNDDSHDITNANEIGVVWTMVNAPGPRAPDVIPALRRGAMYVVAATPGGTPAHLLTVTVRGDTISATFDRAMHTLQVITDHGITSKTATDSPNITYVLDSTVHYARVVASDAGGTLYLNPVIRTDALPVVWQQSTIRPLVSIAMRTGALLLWLGLMALLFWRRRSSRAAPRQPQPALVPRVAIMLLACGLGLPWPHEAGAQAMVATALPFRSGEYHEYDLKFGVITVGSGSLSVSGPDTLRGREVLRLRYEINGGIPFFRVHDVMESSFDVSTMSSLRFTQDLNEGPKHYNRHYDFYPDELIVLERGKPRAATVAAPLDDASFIFFVRTLPLEVGQTMNFSRYFRPNANPVTIEVLRRETITVPAGTFKTIVVKPTIRTSGIFSEGGQAELWFSDNAAHTLIQMKAKLSFGSLSLYLRPSRKPR